MPRHFWISASIAVLVAAFALFALALPRLVMLDESDAGSRGEAGGRQQIVSYTVPPARGEIIRDTLQTVLFAHQQGVQPVGQARLAAPDKLVVSAPVRMHASIGKAIGELAEGDTEATASPSSVAVEIWLIEASGGSAAPDARLAPAEIVLAEARRRFGHSSYRLVDRSMVAAPLNGHSVRLAGTGTEADLRLLHHDARTVDAQINLNLREQGRLSSFHSRLLLTQGQWQLVGLLPDGGADVPERLLLVRQTAVNTGVTAEQ